MWWMSFGLAFSWPDLSSPLFQRRLLINGSRQLRRHFAACIRSRGTSLVTPTYCTCTIKKCYKVSEQRIHKERLLLSLFFNTIGEYHTYRAVPSTYPFLPSLGGQVISSAANLEEGGRYLQLDRFWCVFIAAPPPSPPLIIVFSDRGLSR